METCPREWRRVQPLPVSFQISPPQGSHHHLSSNHVHHIHVLQEVCGWSLHDLVHCENELFPWSKDWACCHESLALSKSRWSCTVLESMSRGACDQTGGTLLNSGCTVSVTCPVAECASQWWARRRRGSRRRSRWAAADLLLLELESTPWWKVEVLGDEILQVEPSPRYLLPCLPPLTASLHDL